MMWFSNKLKSTSEIQTLASHLDPRVRCFQVTSPRISCLTQTCLRLNARVCVAM